MNFLAIKHDLDSVYGVEQSDRMQMNTIAHSPSLEVDTSVIIPAQHTWIERLNHTRENLCSLANHSPPPPPNVIFGKLSSLYEIFFFCTPIWSKL